MNNYPLLRHLQTEANKAISKPNPVQVAGHVNQYLYGHTKLSIEGAIANTARDFNMTVEQVRAIINDWPKWVAPEEI